jgi:hypothetical protein
VALETSGEGTVLHVEVSGLPLDKLFAFGAGWHTHLGGLGAYLAGHPPVDRSVEWMAKWEEFAPHYREMDVVPLEQS